MLKEDHQKGEPSLIVEMLCYLGVVLLYLFGLLNDFLRNFGFNKYNKREENREGYVPLYKGFENFYIRNFYRRVSDAMNRPINCMPGPIIDVMERISEDNYFSFKFTGRTNRVINFVSYNYLGFAENCGPITDSVDHIINRYGVGVGTTRHELGLTEVQKNLEKLLAKFLGVESSIVFGMGFATNSTNIPALGGKGTLIISDQYNHASIIVGCKNSGSTIVLFKHNDMKDLELKIRNGIIEGQPKTGRKWNKIIIFVEGIYSMEGTVVNLPEVIRLKKRYKCYLYVDEAHSIGAIGKRGGGVVDYFGCDPKDVDILMGTFTKSFGAAGGYVAGSKDIINYIVTHSQSACYATTMSSCVAQQITSTLNVIMGTNGTNEGMKRLSRLSQNVQYFKRRLNKMGFTVLGCEDSAVVPILTYFNSKIIAISRIASVNGFGLQLCGYPATQLTKGKIRFCISSSHTKEMLDKVLDFMDTIGDQYMIKYEYK